MLQHRGSRCALSCLCMFARGGREFNRFLSVLLWIYVQPVCKEEEDWINDIDAAPFLQSVPWLLLCN